MKEEAKLQTELAHVVMQLAPELSSKSSKGVPKGVWSAPALKFNKNVDTWKSDDGDSKKEGEESFPISCFRFY